MKSLALGKSPALGKSLAVGRRCLEYAEPGAPAMAPAWPRRRIPRCETPATAASRASAPVSTGGQGPRPKPALASAIGAAVSSYQETAPMTKSFALWRGPGFRRTYARPLDGRSRLTLPRLPRQRSASSAAPARLQPGQFPAQARFARGGGTSVADDASREADQDRRHGASLVSRCSDSARRAAPCWTQLATATQFQIIFTKT